MKFGYSLDKNGRVICCGYIDNYTLFLDGSEPFSGVDCINYKKDIQTGRWIYLPDITQVNRSINRVEYNWHENTVSIYLNDIYRTTPYIFPSVQNMSEQDCIDLINKYTDEQLKNYDL